MSKKFMTWTNKVRKFFWFLDEFIVIAFCRTSPVVVFVCYLRKKRQFSDNRVHCYPRLFLSYIIEINEDKCIFINGYCCLRSADDAGRMFTVKSPTKSSQKFLQSLVKTTEHFLFWLTFISFHCQLIGGSILGISIQHIFTSLRRIRSSALYR